MSTHPRIESRVSVLERRQINLEAHVEELSEDMLASFKQLSEHLGKIEETMATKEDITAVKKEVKEDITTVKKEIKEDITAMENRILDVFKQLLTTVNPQTPPSQ